ncbi:MAG: DNA sulfur modification protein DndE [Luteolibacter sp.]
MNPPVETVRISKQGRDQLIKVRRQTGVENWNILCRWALCVSLREPTPPAQPKEKLDGGIEMTWKVFAGEESETLTALIHLRTEKDGLGKTTDGPGKCLRAHVNRGLSYLASGKETRSIGDFIERWPR